MKLTKYSQLEHGMRVRGLYNGYLFTVAKLAIAKNGDVYVCQNVVGARFTNEMFGYEKSIYLCEKNENSKFWSTNQLFTAEDDELVVEEGDLLVSTDGFYKRVLGVCGCVAKLSVGNQDKNHVELREHDYDCSFYDLKKYGYKVVNEEEKEETTELDGKKYTKKENDDGTITLMPA